MKEILNTFNAIIQDKKKLALLLLAVVFFLYIDFVFVVGTQIKNISFLGPKISQLKKDLSNLNKELANAKTAGALQAKRVQEDSVHAKKIISEDQATYLFENISNLANKNNVKIMSMKPSKDIKTGDDKKSSASNKLIPYFVNLDLSSDYHHLGAFLNSLENAEWFMAIPEMRITRDAVDNLRESVSLVIKTYVKK